MKDLYFQLVMPLASTSGEVTSAIERVTDRHYFDDQKQTIEYEYDYDMNALPVHNDYGQMMANVSVHAWQKEDDDKKKNLGQGQYM